MDIQNAPNSPDESQLAIAQQKLVLENKIKNGIGWFFWLAGLSLVNSIIFLVGGNWQFFFGLGVTQLVDGLMYVLAEEFQNVGSVFTVIGFVINVIIAGIFAAFGYFGIKRHRVPIIVGMVLYVLDGLLLLLFQDFLSAGFHLWALFGIWGGLRAVSELEKFDKRDMAGTIEII